jgi:hypothetical protein
MSVKPFAYIALVDGENQNGVDYDGTEWALGTNVNYFLNNHVSINAGITYISQDVDLDGGGDYKHSGFNTGVSLSVYF